MVDTPLNGRPQPITTTKTDPDPSVLTTESLLREVKWLRELIESRLNADGKEIDLLREAIARVPSMRNEAIDHLQSLHDQKFTGLERFTDERFRSIAIQFSERDTRVEQTAKDSKVAVDAALSAAKDAVTEQNKSTALAIAKSEAAFLKQLDQLVLLLDTKTQSLTKEVDEIRNRQGSAETRDIIRKENIGENRSVADSGRAWLFGAIGALVGLGGLLFAIFSRVT